MAVVGILSLITNHSSQVHDSQNHDGHNHDVGTVPAVTDGPAVPAAIATACSHAVIDMLERTSSTLPFQDDYPIVNLWAGVPPTWAFSFAASAFARRSCPASPSLPSAACSSGKATDLRKNSCFNIPSNKQHPHLRPSGLSLSDRRSIARRVLHDGDAQRLSRLQRRH